MQQALASYGIRPKTTPAYAPHCNPVERTNKTVKTMIAQYVDKNHRRWDRHITALQFAYNTAKHDSTEYTPAFLNYGRELRGPHPEDRRPGQRPVAPEINQQRLEEAYEVVRTNLARAAFQRQARHYDLRRRAWKPQIGEAVWKRTHTLSSKKDAVNAKLSPKYIGPLTVRRIISPVIVDLRDARGRWYKHVHIQDLKPTPGDKHEPPGDNATD